MARDRNEMGGSLGGQSAGQGEATRKSAAEGNRDERSRVRRRKLAAHLRKPDVDETPRPPKDRDGD